ncbi:formate dehydrogenase accessory sulfurtransferase FdhD [Thermodesulfitimonas sp.]
MIDLYLDGAFRTKIHFLPRKPELLLLGHLFLEGLIQSREEVAKIEIDAEKNAAWVTRRVLKGSLCQPASLNQTQPKISPAAVLKLAAALAANPLFRQTGAVHCGLIAAQEEILFGTEDTGRFNVLDKLAGYILREKLSAPDLTITFSGRLTGEIVSRLAKIKVPVVISPAAPTTQGIAIAVAAGITLIGFARGDRFNVYTHAQRLELQSG